MKHIRIREPKRGSRYSAPADFSIPEGITNEEGQVVSNTMRKFERRRGWYEESDELAAFLATQKTLPDDPDCPFIFEVVTAEEARKIDQKEKADGRGTVGEPIREDAVAEPDASPRDRRRARRAA